MLHKIALGTANFAQPYGVLSQNQALNHEDIHAVLALALKQNMRILDTAFGYGDVLSAIGDYTKHFQIITKVSILSDFQPILDSMRRTKDFEYHAILVHDPHNLEKADSKSFLRFLDCARSDHGIQHVGVSAYNIQDVLNFHAITKPDLVQIPLNPLNQTFQCPNFLEYVSKHNVEVHARSLFLQGILLADKLPEPLLDLEPLWSSFVHASASATSRLNALMSWANSKEWVDRWILGVASLKNFEEIIQCAKMVNHENPLKDFCGEYHPLVDPRNWPCS